MSKPAAGGVTLSASLASDGGTDPAATGLQGWDALPDAKFLQCPVFCRTLSIESEAPMPEVVSRTARIEARIAPDVLAAVKRAAEIEGRSVSDFVVDAARHAAERTIEDTQIIRLSLADQQRVAAMLAAPPAASAGLDRAMDAHRALIQAGE